tara:strand:+ start:334 stop:546 length:213 start_codon:yes stop_codon:yes gene_type:complete
MAIPKKKKSLLKTTKETKMASLKDEAEIIIKMFPQTAQDSARSLFMQDVLEKGIAGPEALKRLKSRLMQK